MDLDHLPAGVRVFVDAPIFVYHFTGSSPQCRNLLDRCERGEVDGVTSVTVLAEVNHRLMMVEAVVTGLVRAGNVAKKLRERPDVVRKLKIASEQAAAIPLMGIDVLGLDMRHMLAAAEIRRTHGLMTNDSIIAATVADAGVTTIATADGDFRRVDGLTLFEPTDLSSPRDSRTR